MAETVYLLNGSMEVVLTEKDVFIERLNRAKIQKIVGGAYSNLCKLLMYQMKNN